MNHKDNNCSCISCRNENPSLNRVRRLNALQKVGTVCRCCGEWFDEDLPKSNLELHHLYYTEGNQKDQKSTVLTTIEALKHPYRFWSLCKICHILHTILINSEWKLLSFFERYYLRQLKYTFPYDTHLKDIGKGYIFFKDQYDYNDPKELHEEFSKFMFKTNDELIEKYDYIKSISMDCGLISHNHSRNIDEKDLGNVKNKILFELDDILQLYSEFFIDHNLKNVCISDDITYLIMELKEKIKVKKSEIGELEI